MIFLKIFPNKHQRKKDVEKKTLEKLKGQLRMDNPEKLATWGTQDTGRRQIKKTKKPQHNMQIM